MHLNIFLKQRIFFAVINQKCEKCTIFNILMIITLGVNMINRQMPHFSHLLLSSIHWYTSFSHFKNFKIQFHAHPLHHVMVCQIHIYMIKMTISNLLKKISIFYVKFVNFWYITCFVSPLIPV